MMTLPAEVNTIALTTGAECELAHRRQPHMAFEHPYDVVRREAEEDWSK